MYQLPLVWNDWSISYTLFWCTWSWFFIFFIFLSQFLFSVRGQKNKTLSVQNGQLFAVYVTWLVWVCAEQFISSFNDCKLVCVCERVCVRERKSTDRLCGCVFPWQDGGSSSESLKAYLSGKIIRAESSRESGSKSSSESTISFKHKPQIRA